MTKEIDFITFEDSDTFGMDISFETEPPLDAIREDNEKLTLSIEALEDQVKEQKQISRQIMMKITKLLNGLKQNPEKEKIIWPNRVKDIDAFLEELNVIYKAEGKK